MERLLTTFFNPPIDQPSHRLGAIAGIEIRAVPGWWLTLLGMLAAGQVVGWIIGPGEGVERILAGLGYGLIFVGSQVVHAAGHMVSGRLVDAPMDALLVTMTRWVNVYDDTGKRIPRRVHLGRALGGPIGGDPLVALSSVGRIEVLARSWDGMLHRIHQLQEGGWSRWHSLGGPMEGIPTAATNPTGDLELFVRWTDGRLAHRWQVGGGDWSDWEFIDASLTGNPVAVTLATGRLGVFAPAANGQVVYRLQSPDGSWSDWLLLVQAGAGSIEAVRTRVFIDVFISQPMQPVLWTRVTAEGQWIAWEPLGTRSLTLIDAATNASSNPIVLAIDNATSELLWSFQSSEGLWSAWQPMPDPSQASPIDLHAAPL